MAMIERLLLRRREVLGRWDEFYGESANLAKAVGLALDAPRLELRIGPRYPTDIIITRERVFEFLNDFARRQRVGFLQEETLRHPAGAFLNIGEIGTVHYLEPLELRKATETTVPNTHIWWITAPILRVISVVSDLMKTHGVACDLRIEAKLVDVAQVPFYLHASDFRSGVRSVAFPLIPAFVAPSSETLAEQAEEVTTELLYQLRWPFGRGQGSSKDEIGRIVAEEHRRG
jgi:hypothetical protein